MMQFLPFCDPEAVGLLRDFEQAVYANFSRELVDWTACLRARLSNLFRTTTVREWTREPKQLGAIY
jgi:hypothetical protein